MGQSRRHKRSPRGKNLRFFAWGKKRTPRITCGVLLMMPCDKNAAGAAHPAEQKSESNAIVPAQRRGTRSGANVRIFETRRHSRRRIRKHPTEFLRGVANDALRLCGAANRICKERSDGIAYFAPSDLRAEFTQGATGSPGENLRFSAGVKKSR